MADAKVTGTMDDTVSLHKKGSKRSLNVAIVTVSDTRNESDDASGALLKEFVEGAGHSVFSYTLVKDEKEEIVFALDSVVGSVHCVIFTGGTGISGRDVTVESLVPLFDKELVAFQSLFAQLSYQKVGSAAVLSRATAGVIQKTVVFCLPGSPRACDLAMKKLIIPELFHILKQIGALDG